MTKIDLDKTSVRSLNSNLQDNKDNSETLIENPKGKHNLAVGLTTEQKVHIHGHVGYYCAGMNQKANILIEGNAGPGLAENMMSGVVKVEGNASQYCGATAHGGLLVIKNDAAARCGVSMKGVDIVVGGSVGHMSAFMGQKGRLVICGDAGNALGDSIYEARIYLRGTVESLGTDCIEKEMKQEHKQELRELLNSAGFDDMSLDGFRRYGSARKLYNFDIDNAY
jgi:glutamate synthase domain-containing protein 3